MKRIILLVVFLSILLMSIPKPAFAADKSMVSGTICKPYAGEDFSHLRYYVRGIKAVGKDVTVECPIIRDSIGSGDKKLKFVQVFYNRTGEGKVSLPAIEGTVYSCTPYGLCPDSRDGFTVPQGAPYVKTNTNTLPVSEFSYFVYKTTIPENAILLSIYTEEQD